MIIDEHRHVGYASSRPERSVDDILRELDELGADRAVLAPGAPRTSGASREEEIADTEEHYSRGEELLATGRVTPEIQHLRSLPVDHSEVVAAVRAHPQRLLGCFFLNPWLGEVGHAEARSAVREEGFRYLKLHPPMHFYASDDEAVMGPVMELAAELDVPVWFHSSSGPGSEFQRTVRLARRFPAVKVILGHVLGGLDEAAVGEVAQATTELENLWVDLSHGRLPQIQQIVARAPGDRLLLASDDPWGYPLEEYGLAAMIRKVRQATEGRETLRRGFMGENAARLLRIA